MKKKLIAIAAAALMVVALAGCASSARSSSASASASTDGQYKLVTRDGNGPWQNKRDTMIVDLKGSTEVQVEVTPYFTISNASLSVSGTTMNASFNINQVVPSASINKVYLLLSKTQFADDVNNLYRKDVSDVTPGAVSLTADLTGNNDVAKATALFARVGVLANGADQAIYSEVIRIR